MSRAGNALLRGVDAEALSQTSTACAPLTSSPSSGCSPSRTASQGPPSTSSTTSCPSWPRSTATPAPRWLAGWRSWAGPSPATPRNSRSGARLGPFRLPAETSDPAAITDYALERVRGLIGIYGETLDRTRDADELTHRLLLKLVRKQVEMEADLEGVSPAT
jgi:hypothetical protein